MTAEEMIAELKLLAPEALAGTLTTPKKPEPKVSNPERKFNLSQEKIKEVKHFIDSATAHKYWEPLDPVVAKQVLKSTKLRHIVNWKELGYANSEEGCRKLGYKEKQKLSVATVIERDEWMFAQGPRVSLESLGFTPEFDVELDNYLEIAQNPPETPTWEPIDPVVAGKLLSPSTKGNKMYINWSYLGVENRGEGLQLLNLLKSTKVSVDVKKPEEEVKTLGHQALIQPLTQEALDHFESVSDFLHGAKAIAVLLQDPTYLPRTPQEEKLLNMFYAEAPRSLELREDKITELTSLSTKEFITSVREYINKHGLPPFLLYPKLRQ